MPFLSDSRFKGTTKLEPSERVVYEKDGDRHRLTLRGTQPGEAGQYMVKATNPAGSASAAAKLLVKSKPWLLLLLFIYFL